MPSDEVKDLMGQLDGMIAETRESLGRLEAARAGLANGAPRKRRKRRSPKPKAKAKPQETVAVAPAGDPPRVPLLG